MNNSTLTAGSEIDARFAIQKAGWDGTPREWLSSDVLLCPIWEIGFSLDAYDMMQNPVAHVTNFPGEGPMATIRFKETEFDDFMGDPLTVSADTLDDLFDLVVVTCRNMDPTTFELGVAS
tara:strand:+ start:106 stop:465 length:360 start_codon:yes stop_codon:yes gene_type:complete